MSKWTTAMHLLDILKQNPQQFCSGATLSARLGLTRSAIWKQIHRLKQQGYEILTHPKQGYQLIGTPDLLIDGEVTPYLQTSWLGSQYHHLDQVGSTNDYAMQLASCGAPHGTVIVAEEQLAGKGRLARKWISARGAGLYLTAIIRDALPSRDAPKVSLLAALSLVTVLRDEYGVAARIKWPNDVLVSGRKIAGILSEMQADQDFVRFLVVGIGINVNHTPDLLRGPFRYPATSLSIETQARVQRSGLLLALLREMERTYDRLRREDFAVFVPALEANSAIIGETVEIQCVDETINGRALGITSDGALRMLDTTGRERVIWVGDIIRVGKP